MKFGFKKFFKFLNSFISDYVTCRFHKNPIIHFKAKNYMNNRPNLHTFLFSKLEIYLIYPHEVGFGPVLSLDSDGIHRVYGECGGDGVP